MCSLVECVLFARQQGLSRTDVDWLLYEVGPMAYLLEKAGGCSSDGRQSILDILVTNTEQRTQVMHAHTAHVLTHKCMMM